MSLGPGVREEIGVILNKDGGRGGATHHLGFGDVSCLWCVNLVINPLVSTNPLGNRHVRLTDLAPPKKFSSSLMHSLDPHEETIRLELKFQRGCREQGGETL